MKKMFAVLCILCLFFGTCSSFAEESLILEKSKEIPDINEINSLIQSTAEKSSALSTNDVVVIHDDGTIEVTVEKQVTLSIYPPFGWIVFTQDVLAQFDLYLTFISDIEGLINQFKETDIHAYALDLSSDSVIIFRVYKDQMALLFGDLNECSDNSLRVLQEAMNSASAVIGYQDFFIEKLGNNTFLVGTNEEGMKYSTYLNGFSIDVLCFPSDESFSDYDMETIEYFLTDLVISKSTDI